MTATKLLGATDLFFLARVYVDDLLKAQLPHSFAFHSLDRTHDVIMACNLIAENEHVDLETHENILLAACFHGTGYTGPKDTHVHASIEIASHFLQSRHENPAKIKIVVNLLRTFLVPNEPNSIAECIVRDADSFHLSKSNYQEYLLQLRREAEYVFKRKYADKEWLLMNLNFLNEHKYFTHYAIENWEEMKMNNLGFLEKVSHVILPYDTM